MKEELLGILRDREKGVATFRKTSDKLARVLVKDMSEKLDNDGVSAEEIMVVPILRSGMVFVPAFAEEYPGVPVGVLGIRRDEQTAEPEMYYKNFPAQAPPVAVIVDPMLATGGSATMAVDALVQEGVSTERTYFLGIVAAQEGLDRLASKIPEENIILGAVDPGLDAGKYIVPGLGDFGDRYFGTPVE